MNKSSASVLTSVIFMDFYPREKCMGSAFLGWKLISNGSVSDVGVFYFFAMAADHHELVSP